MTIDASMALRIADSAALKLGWGSVTAESHEAVPVTIDHRRAWDVDLKRRGWIGKRVRFLIDAETGEILEQRRMGTR